MRLVGYVSVNDFDGFVMPVFKEGNAFYYQDFDESGYFASKYPYLIEIHLLDDAPFGEFDLSRKRIFAIKAKGYVKAGYADEIIRTIEEKHLFDFFEKEEIEVFKEKYCSKAIALPGRMEHHERVFTRTQYLPRRPVQQHGLRARHRHLGTVMGLLYCVSKNQISGKWQVGLASNKKVVKSFDTQKEAMSFVRKMAIAKASSAQTKKSKPSAKAKLVKK